ncbi:hypothetical protein [Tellurirhabdus bombi]|uniref:hypothetical protein n=1 Tax=Tellurirhabdus bombi TaxID=2907205 RepID=UPI001F42CE39|nr:hypothetical protein [Tellurirhabdus bombi]
MEKQLMERLVKDGFHSFESDSLGVTFIGPDGRAWQANRSVNQRINLFLGDELVITVDSVDEVADFILI